MKQRKLLGIGFLLWAVLGLAVSSCKDDKDPEIVPDPMDNIEYYLSGTVLDLDNSAALAGVEVSTGDFSSTTAADGTYTIIVKTKKTYELTFTKSGYLTVSTEATIGSNATNHAMLNVSVKLGKKGPEKTVTTAGAEVGNKADAAASDVSVVIPAGAIPAGQTAYISVTQFEQPEAASTVVTTGTRTISAALDGLHIETNITDFNAPVTLTWKEICSTDVSFAEATVWSKGAINKSADSRAAGYAKEGVAINNNGNYHFETAHLKSNYLLEVNTEVNTGSQKSETNLVNGQESVKVDNSGNTAAIVDYKLEVKVKTGWDYTTNPTTALAAIGITGDDLPNMAASISKIIEGVEDGPRGFSTYSMVLLSSISGGYIMYYHNDAKYVERTYTFDIVIKGGKNQKAVVKVKTYVGNVQTYTNVESNQHSGGKL